jgi:hypothetical protein
MKPWLLLVTLHMLLLSHGDGKTYLIETKDENLPPKLATKDIPLNPPKPAEAVPAKPEAIPAKSAEAIPTKPAEAIPAKSAEAVPAKPAEAIPAKPAEAIPAKSAEAATLKPAEKAPSKTADNVQSMPNHKPNTKLDDAELFNMEAFFNTTDTWEVEFVENTKQTGTVPPGKPVLYIRGS